MEWAYHPHWAYFCTFTYHPDYLPEGGNLDKVYFLKWLKNVQKRKTGAFRYYCVGEYGSQSKRPHYHMAVFPEHFTQVKVLLEEWKKGFTRADEITHARARYLANYTAKNATSVGPDGLEPEFRTSSRNPPLGAAFVAATIKQYQTVQGKRLLEERGDVERCFRFDGKVYPIGGWALAQIRKSLSIPLEEKRRRLLHPNYEKYFRSEHAYFDYEEAEQQELFLNVTQKQGFHRGKGPKI